MFAVRAVLHAFLRFVIWRDLLRCTYICCASTKISSCKHILMSKFLSKGTVSRTRNVLNWLSAERPRKTLGEQPGFLYCVQDDVAFYLGCNHDTQSRIQTQERRNLRIKSYDYSRRLRPVYRDDFLFGNIPWTG